MNLTEKVKEAYNSLKKNLWLLFVPVLFDFISFFSYLYIFHGKYTVPNKAFIIKLGAVSAPPGINYILENFPSFAISYNSNYGSTGVINSINLFSILYLLSILLISSFFRSGYLGCLSRSHIKKLTIIDFIRIGNKYWFRYFVLGIIMMIPAALMFKSQSFILLCFIFVIFYFVPYSIVVDNCSFMVNFSKGISVLSNELGTTIKMVLYYGVLVSLLSPIVFALSRNFYGILCSIMLVDFFGMVINKAVMEVYRELANKPAADEQDIVEQGD